jgi:uncharacterized protein (TIGR02145 family)
VGWHVPSDAEWTVLTDFLGGESVAGGKMKSIGTIEAETGLWYAPNAGATNSSGFSGVAAGIRNYAGSFSFIGNDGWYLGTMDGEFNEARLRVMYYFEDIIFQLQGAGTDLLFGYSVRCLRD